MYIDVGLPDFHWDFGIFGCWVVVYDALSPPPTNPLGPETSQDSHSGIIWNPQVIQRSEQSGLPYPSFFQAILVQFHVF